MSILRVTSAQYLGNHRLQLEFNNRTKGTVDLSEDFGGPIFQPLRDAAYFSTFKLEGGTIAWPNGADLAPEYLASRLVEQSRGDNLVSLGD